MTIGPLPITRMDLISVRRGITRSPVERARRTLCIRVLLLPTKQALLRRALGRRILLRRIRSVGCHQVNKTIEEVAGVVRPGGGLWVVLHRKGPQPSVLIR